LWSRLSSSWLAPACECWCTRPDWMRTGCGGAIRTDRVPAHRAGCGFGLSSRGGCVIDHT
jgi:hypothetical protein